MTSFATAVERGHYELAALRLLLAIAGTLERLDGAAASRARARRRSAKNWWR
ncbi:MAG: hypothetical protein QF664_12510 [Dehalococcoidia bacterium]|jgi:hypothetical protein|nr:hypothetical protein [Dehalococcoidia bacterium]